MFKPVQKNVNFPALEENILKFWEEKQIFQKTSEQRSECPEFVFYDGPPGTNGRPHIGHMMQSALKDLWPRYKIMNGFHVIRKAGWDTHGLPIELTAERELKLSSKRDILTFGEDKYIDYCRSTVFRYKESWEKAIRRIGRFLDMEHPYLTLSNDYIQSDWYLLKLAWNRKLEPDRIELQGKSVSPRFLYKDYRIMPYCARCGTTLSNFEVAEGYKDVIDMTLTAKFRVQGMENTFIAAWTTTAWTLLSNVALAVGPEVDYVAVKLQGDTEGAKAGQTIIMAAARLEAYKKQLEPYDLLWTRKGSELAGLEYFPLWDFQVNPQAHRVVSDDYVTTEDGTGIVHLALYGDDDFRIIRREGFPLVQNVAENGLCTQNAGQYAGRYFKDETLDIDVLKDLKQRDLLLAKEKHEHSYPFCYRCDAALMYFARPGWFLRTASYRPEMLRANAYINWQPNHIKEGRFGNWLENTIDWNVTRERYWGSPFPVWACADPDCPGEVCAGSLDELRQFAGSETDKILFNEKLGALDLHKPLIDRLKIPCPHCSKPMSRENFVLDSWFNAGLMFIGQWGYPATLGSKEIFARQYPCDFICEAIDQTRGWFYTLLATSTLFSMCNDFPEQDWSCYRNVICTDLVLDEEGRKMSKSRGNVIDPATLFEKFGADATRWSFYTTNPWNVRRFSAENVKDCVRDVLLPLWNSYSFFITYARVDNWTPNKTDLCQDHPLDRWLLGELTRCQREVSQALDQYDVAPASSACARFLDQLTNWYIRRSRRRFWKSEDDHDKQSAYATLYQVLTDFCLILAPFMPFVSEEIYQNLVTTVKPEAPESVHLAAWPKPALDKIDEELAATMEFARKIVRSGRDLRQKHSIKVRQPIAEVKAVISDGTFDGIKAMKDLILEELNAKKFTLLKDDKTLVQLIAKPNLKALGPHFKNEMNKVAEVIKAFSPDVVQQIADGLSVKKDGFDIQPDDVIIEQQAPTNCPISNSEGFTVALNLELSDDLVAEGLAREIVHCIQNLRREADLEVTDQIRIRISTDESAIINAIAAHNSWIRTETLAKDLSVATEPPNSSSKPIKIDQYSVYLTVEKAI